MARCPGRVQRAYGSLIPSPTVTVSSPQSMDAAPESTMFQVDTRVRSVEAYIALQYLDGHAVARRYRTVHSQLKPLLSSL